MIKKVLGSPTTALPLWSLLLWLHGRREHLDQWGNCLFLRTQSSFSIIYFVIFVSVSFITLIFIYCHILLRFPLSSFLFSLFNSLLLLFFLAPIFVSFVLSLPFSPFHTSTFTCLPTLCISQCTVQSQHNACPRYVSHNALCKVSTMPAHVMYLTMHCAKSAQCLPTLCISQCTVQSQHNACSVRKTGITPVIVVFFVLRFCLLTHILYVKVLEVVFILRSYLRSYCPSHAGAVHQ